MQCSFMPPTFNLNLGNKYSPAAFGFNGTIRTEPIHHFDYSLVV